MKNKITILYDNTDNYTNIEETKEFLFDTFSEERIGTRRYEVFGRK